MLSRLELLHAKRWLLGTTLVEGLSCCALLRELDDSVEHGTVQHDYVAERLADWIEAGECDDDAERLVLEKIICVLESGAVTPDLEGWGSRVFMQVAA